MVGADAEDPKIPHRFRSNLRPGLNHGAACVAALLLGMFLFLVIETATAGQFPSSKASLFGSPALLHELEQMDEGLLRRFLFFRGQLTAAFFQLAGHLQRLLLGTAQRHQPCRKFFDARHRSFDGIFI